MNTDRDYADKGWLRPIVPEDRPLTRLEFILIAVVIVLGVVLGVAMMHLG